MFILCLHLTSISLDKGNVSPSNSSSVIDLTDIFVIVKHITSFNSEFTTETQKAKTPDTYTDKTCMFEGEIYCSCSLL